MINKWIGVGHVGTDPEYTLLSEEYGVVEFSFATGESWTRDGKKHTETTWHKIKAYRGLAVIISKYVKKGALLYLEGKSKTRSFEKEGNKVYTTEIILDEMKMLGKKPD